MMRHQPQHLDFHQLLSDRLFRIPQYQRSYSWGSRHRQDLFQDIVESYKSPNTSDHFMATVVALAKDKVRIEGIPNQLQRIEVVDGQQRITTLVLLLKAIEKALDEANASERSLKEEILKTLIKPSAVELLLQTNHDSSDHFARYIRTGESQNPAQAKTLADRQLLLAMTECERFVEEWQSGGDSLADLVDHMYNRLTFI